MSDSEKRAAIYHRLIEGRPQGARFTPELTAELKAIDGAQCLHDRSRIVRYQTQGGGAQARKQCLECGDVFGSAVRAVGSYPNWDSGLLVMWIERRIAQRKAVFARHESLQTVDLIDKREQHAAYLQSQTWRIKRKRVLERCGGACEGCRDQRATQVHHLTYKHWGRELLFELVALCDECHAVCHEDRVATPDSAA